MYTNRIPGNSLSDSCQMTPVVAHLKNLHIFFIYEVPKSEIFFSLACAFWDLHTGIARQITKVRFLDFYVIKNVFFFSFKLIQYFAACCLIWIQSGVIHQQPLHHHYHKKVVRADPWFDPILTFKPICHSYHTHHYYLSVLKHVMNKLWHGLPAPAKKKKKKSCPYSCCPDISQRILGMSQAPIGFLSPICWE